MDPSLQKWASALLSVYAQSSVFKQAIIIIKIAPKNFMLSAPLFGIPELMP